MRKTFHIFISELVLEEIGSGDQNAAQERLTLLEDTLHIGIAAVQKIDFFTEDKILIESKFYAELNKKQEKLFNEYPANKKLLIDSVEKLEILNEI